MPKKPLVSQNDQDQQTKSKNAGSLRTARKHPAKKRRRQIDLKFNASSVGGVLRNVSLCLTVVVLVVHLLADGGQYSSDLLSKIPMLPFHSDTPDAGLIAIESVANALIVTGILVLKSLVLWFLLHFGYKKLHSAYHIIMMLAMFTYFTAINIRDLFKTHNLPLDYPSLAFVVWNWSLVGLISDHCKFPSPIREFYNCAYCVILALVFIRHLPEWTVWTLLAFQALWDLYSIMCLASPFNMLVINKSKSPPAKKRKKRRRLVGANSVAGADSTVNSEHQQRQQQQQMKDLDIVLGQGDYIYCSLLVGKASTFGDWSVTVACFLCTLLGVATSVVLLGSCWRHCRRDRLPGLPLPIFMGSGAFSATRWLIRAFMDPVIVRQILL